MELETFDKIKKAQEEMGEGRERGGGACATIDIFRSRMYTRIGLAHPDPKIIKDINDPK